MKVTSKENVQDAIARNNEYLRLWLQYRIDVIKVNDYAGAEHGHVPPAIHLIDSDTEDLDYLNYFLREDGRWAKIDFQSDKYLLKEDAHTHENLNVLDNLSSDENDNLLYNGKQLKPKISNKTGNQLQELNDGLYVSTPSSLSEEEQIIGKDINNEDIYQITKIFDIINYDSQQIERHNIKGIKDIVGYYGYLIDEESNHIQCGFFDGINYLSCKPNYNNIVIIRNNNNIWANRKFYITLRYTKIKNNTSNFILADNNFFVTQDNNIFYVRD